jgi:signal transduction histidine kinase
MQVALSNLRNDTVNREHAERLDLVIAEVRRITSLLNGLLEGARHTPEPLADVGLAETVRGLLALAHHQIPGKIRIDCDIQDGLDCRLPCDRFKQALLNLVINAAHAIGDRQGLITVSAQRDAGTVALVVCDNGPGFPRAVLERLPSLRDGAQKRHRAGTGNCEATRPGSERRAATFECGSTRSPRRTEIALSDER